MINLPEEYSNWTRQTVEIDGKQVEVYQAKTWGKIINVDVALVHFRGLDYGAEFLRCERLKALVALD